MTSAYLTSLVASSATSRARRFKVWVLRRRVWLKKQQVAVQPRVAADVLAARVPGMRQISDQTTMAAHLTVRTRTVQSLGQQRKRGRTNRKIERARGSLLSKKSSVMRHSRHLTSQALTTEKALRRMLTSNGAP